MTIPIKKVILPMAAVSVLAAAGVGISQVSAASSPGSQTLVQRIASAFHLNQTQVQQVVDQYRQDQQSSRETNYQARLDKAVTDGQITSAQESAILSEQQKLEGERTAAMKLTGTARTAAMKQMRMDARTWAQQNNLSVSWLLGGRPLRGGNVPPAAPSS